MTLVFQHVCSTEATDNAQGIPLWELHAGIFALYPSKPSIILIDCSLISNYVFHLSPQDGTRSVAAWNWIRFQVGLLNLSHNILPFMIKEVFMRPDI